MEFTKIFISNNLKRKKKAKRLWTGSIYARYRYYCNLHGRKPLGNITFYKQLEQCGLKRSENKFYFYGVELKDVPTEDTLTDMEKWSRDIQR
ncbi:hypothetical protein SporoP37_02010 [Sporosarcina sp. P37]|uniref:primase-like DNA-binding domain-containing protein n=1 Tax=unclassified Sporosarcina TaxID=2647733 RepID=UPI000A17E31B|nr:hypothetical protein SporoP37_02010 [Sporosarcina sp. P37]PID18791.1 hypothetical protein CSV62_06740 [Sporosarcina sp. P35]